MKQTWENAKIVKPIGAHRTVLNTFSIWNILKLKAKKIHTTNKQRKILGDFTGYAF